MADPVLIIGAGPTGLTAALELSRLGIPVRIVDRLPEPRTTSRAIGVQARTLELLAARGLADELIARGRKARGGSIHGGGKSLVHIDFSKIQSRYNYILFVSQAETERVLRDALARNGVTIERGVELIAYSQDPLSHEQSPVGAVLRHPDGKLEYTHAPWLISAEGAHSLVRTTLDLRFDGRTFDDEYALGDLYLDGDLPSDDFYVFSSDHGFLVMFPLGDQHFRLIASEPPGTATRDAPPTLEALQAIYDQRSEIPVRLRDMVWSAWFRINSRMIAHLRHGRVFFGGDSAHIHSPAGAQGMNTGIQDMIDLCWKLAMVIEGRAPDALLDTYEQDRLPVIRHVLTRTERLTDQIGSENRLLRGAFNQFAPWIGNAAFVQETGVAIMSQIALGYRNSPLSDNHAHGGSLRAGDRVPDMPVRLKSGGADRDVMLSETLDPSRFVLLVIQPAGEGRLARTLAEAVRPWHDPVKIVEISARPEAAEDRKFEAAFGRATAFLIRPDFYIALAAGEHAAPAHLKTYFERWLSAG